MHNAQPVPTIELNNGVAIPQLGFGVFQVQPDETEAVVSQALEAGYRHLDTAAAYRNEEAVGRAIAASGIPRDELFVTTKLWNADQGGHSALGALDASLERLSLDHVDLYLIHWPVPSRDLYVESWQALEPAAADGRARAIGVSNFQIPHLERLAQETGTVPAVNQIELHPRLQQEELRRHHDEHGIVTEAYSPLAQGGLLDDPVITEIAGAHDRTPAQIVLRWHLQIGNVVIPKSATPERIRTNFDVFSFELTEHDMQRIAALDRGERTGGDPETFALM
jgi:2,5-diketo-D-gluconate reductase A